LVPQHDTAPPLDNAQEWNCTPQSYKQPLINTFGISLSKNQHPQLTQASNHNGATTQQRNNARNQKYRDHPRTDNSCKAIRTNLTRPEAIITTPLLKPKTPIGVVRLKSEMLPPPSCTKKNIVSTKNIFPAIHNRPVQNIQQATSITWLYSLFPQHDTAPPLDNAQEWNCTPQHYKQLLTINISHNLKSQHRNTARNQKHRDRCQTDNGRKEITANLTPPGAIIKMPLLKPTTPTGVMPSSVRPLQNFTKTQVVSTKIIFPALHIDQSKKCNTHHLAIIVASPAWHRAAAG
jgi:hypothetical protein